MNATKTSRPYHQPQSDETSRSEGDPPFEEREWLLPPADDSEGPPEPGQIGPLQQALYFSVLARS